MSALTASLTGLLGYRRVPVPPRLSAVTRVGTERPPARGGLDEQDVNAIWGAVRGLYRTGVNPGIALCLRREGEVILDRTIGYRDTAGTEVLSPDTPVCLFSASKAVTAMLTHHLVETGALRLDDPVVRYVPEYGRNGKQHTTILHLLNHRAGLPRLRHANDPELLFDLDRVRQMLYDAAPETPTGSTQAYHAITAGFILGEVIERVTGEPLNAVLDRVIRQPLGMKYFTFGIGREVPVAENAVSGLKLVPPVSSLVRHAVGATLEQVVEVSNDPRFRDLVIPAGNLYATAEEASRFFQMLLDLGRWQDRQVFHPDTVRNAVRGARRPAFDRSLMIPLRFSAGLMRGNPGISLFGPGAPRAFGHLGFINILCWADPERKLSGALLTTGKGALGPHFPGMMWLQHVINRHTLKR